MPLRNPVSFVFDGEPVEAERGEPIAASLIAAGRLALARSPKFHRPRGPACMRGACDGCLVRIDGVPNSMACLTPAQAGLVIEVQNTLGGRQIDLLRVTDWFFPEGMNHHELFAGVPGVQNVMQAFARRVAGLGKVPSVPSQPRRARRRDADVVVVGAGPAGMAASVRLAARGRRVEVLDDALEAGGGLVALGPEDRRAFRPLEEPFDKAVKEGAVRLRVSTTVGGIYGDDLLVVGREGAEILAARTVVLAPGAHDGVLPFEGNDVPGVMSARAAGLLLRWGVLVGSKAVVAVAPGGGPFGKSFARAAAAQGAKVTLAAGVPVRVSGSSAVRGVVVGKETYAADALVVDAPRAPAYELCEQAGAALLHEPRGFVTGAPRGRIREGFFAVGEAVGTPFEPRAFAEEADMVFAGA